MSSTRAEIKRLTQTRVLDAAEQIFQEEGFAGASIRGIAKSAGVSAGTVMSVARSLGEYQREQTRWTAVLMSLYRAASSRNGHFKSQ